MSSSNFTEALMLLFAASRRRVALTPEQEAEREQLNERALWNRQVEAKKAAKRARKEVANRE